MVGITITREEESADELRRLARVCRDVAQPRRLLAIALVMDGRSRTDAATAAGMDRQSMRDSVDRFTRRVHRDWSTSRAAGVRRG